jgi:hypothetical protein
VATEWLERYRGFWEGRYQKLDALLDSLVAKEKRPLRVSSKPFAPQTRSARRKNAAPAYRPGHKRGGPQPHALSQAYAAFYRSVSARSEGLLRERVHALADS